MPSIEDEDEDEDVEDFHDVESQSSQEWFGFLGPGGRPLVDGLLHAIHA